MYRLEDVLNGASDSGRVGLPGLRGGSREAARAGHASFTIATRWNLTEQGTDVEIVHSITCQVEPELAIIDESLSIADEEIPLFRTTKDERWGPSPEDFPPMHWVHYRAFSASNVSMAIGLPNEYSVLNFPTPPIPQDARVGSYSAALRKALGQVAWLDLDPRAMRAYASRKARHLGPQGENLSAVVWRLCQNPDHKQNLIDWLSELCSPMIADIDFIEVPELDDVMLELVEKSGVRVSVRSLSDGTLRFLGLLTYLMTAPTGAVLLMEEIETGLHPSRANLVVEALEAWVEERDIQVLATTHSPLVLQQLSRETLDQAVVFGRVEDLEGTTTRRLGELLHFDEIAQRRGVDHLFTTGWLERAL